MKKLFIFVFITFMSSQSLSANDIKEFEIEGMSIGHSLLKYMSKSQIETSKFPIIMAGKKLHEYQKVSSNVKSDNYDSVLLYFKNGDPEKIIVAISGRKFYKNNFDECYKLQNTIVSELETIFPNERKVDHGKEKIDSFPDGNSYMKLISFFLNDGSAQVGCYDFSKTDTNSRDRLSVAIFSKQYEKWYHSIGD